MEEFLSSVRSVRFGVFEVDLRSGELRKKGAKIGLQGQPFLLLMTLLKQQGEVVSHEELRRTLWPADTFVDFDHGLGTAVKKLCEVLGDSASNPRFVETIPRRGYRFIAPIETIGESETGVTRLYEEAIKQSRKALYLDPFLPMDTMCCAKRWRKSISTTKPSRNFR
jgi:DNA-binding winged helix-turn-helix (wHTH) protein